MTVDAKRIYTGEFPPDGPDNVDDLIREFIKAIERVRAKFGAAVNEIVDTTHEDPRDVIEYLNKRAATLLAIYRGCLDD